MDPHLSQSVFAYCHGVSSHVFTSYYSAKSQRAFLRLLVFFFYIAPSLLELQFTISILLKLLELQSLSSQIIDTAMI